MRLWKNRPKCSPTHFCLKLLCKKYLPWKKASTNWAIVVFFVKLPWENNLPKFANSGHPGERGGSLEWRWQSWHRRHKSYLKWDFHHTPLSAGRRCSCRHTNLFTQCDIEKRGRQWTYTYLHIKPRATCTTFEFTATTPEEFFFGQRFAS
jgi:hypothetical protein